MQSRYRYCSWCFKKTGHALFEQNYVRRNIWKCQSCGNFTVICRYCKNMAKGKPGNWEKIKSEESFFRTIGANWDNELCAEHDGTIASFAHLNDKWDDLEEYKVLFKRNKKNLKKAGIIGGVVIGSTVVFMPIALAAAPGIASGLGSAGLLGAASTGTAISSLSGAALTSASLAAIGGGTMATGVVFITATGMALGAVQGGVISNNYFGDIKNFKINKYNEGKRRAIVFIDGFLTEKKNNISDWKTALREKYIDASWYHVEWESKALRDIGTLGLKGAGKAQYRKWAIKAAGKASKKLGKKINPLTWLTLAGDIASNPWHTAQVKASKTGILLADLLSRVKDTEFILMGHSLGARVIYYLLSSLSTRDQSVIKDVYLFGGAVNSQNSKDWKKALGGLRGSIFNCYSNNDKILKWLYKPSNAWLSYPIGLEPIKYKTPKIKNYDMTDLVGGHTDYKPNLKEILNIIESQER